MSGVSQVPIPSAVSADKSAMEVSAFSAAQVGMAPAFRHWLTGVQRKSGTSFCQ